MSRSTIRAIVTTNSSADEFGRVQVKSEGIWDENQGSPLIESVGTISLVEGDVVYVSIVDGYEHPLILGRSQDKSAKHSIDEVQGSILFDSSDGENWTICYVLNDKLYMENSKGVKTTFESGDVSIEHENYTFKLEEGKVATLKNSDGSEWVIDGTDWTLTNGTVKCEISGSSLKVSGATEVEVNGSGHPAPWGDKVIEHLKNLYGFVENLADAVGSIGTSFTTAAAGVVTPVGPGTIPNFIADGASLLAKQVSIKAQKAAKEATCTEQLVCSAKTKLD